MSWPVMDLSHEMSWYFPFEDDGVIFRKHFGKYSRGAVSSNGSRSNTVKSQTVTTVKIFLK